ncbi:hypothetical protein VMCG_02465 [Cytospora schulzeri]|uniref:Uncharacterized protein n=1 Tax=Cytospora schulzeri TaxID=448051 RepID=A0A423X0W0_9PEZI|nr:hypothetical protein VMCG_02465 [Valsa malicola]
MAHPRPSTSGGLPAKGSSRANFDKRMSKDDMFFNSARQKYTFDKRMSRDDMHIRSRVVPMSQYHVPVRGPNLTPEHSPLHPVIHEVSVPIRMQTPESMKSGETPIGMALGSPSLPPTDTPKRQTQFPPASSHTATSSQSSAAATAPTGSLQRKRTGRRTLFGLFGGGKKKEEAQGSGQGEAGKSTTTLGRLRAASTSTINVSTKGTPTRSQTQTERKVPKHKPIMIRSQTLPYNPDGSPSQPDNVARPNLRTKASEPYIRKGNVHQRSQPNSSIPPVPSFLDVHIPDTTLERYSVMFSDVLNEGPKQETTVSLLARRQATLERLKTINNNIQVEDAEKEKSRQRRATSPQPAPSPKLALFPMPPTGRITPAMDTPKSQSRLARSNTSPGRLPTPTQATFDIQQVPTTAKTPHAKTLAVPNPFESSPPQTMSSSGKKELAPIYPTDTSFHFGTDEPETILESPTDMDAPEELVITQPLRPTLHEPQWQMMSPPPVATSPEAPSVQSSTTSSGGRRRSPSSASTATARTHTTKPSSEIDDADAAFQNAVEVVKSASPTRRLTEDEAIKVTKINTPTLVNPRENPVNPAHLAQNRKSSWAVVEDGE